MEFVCDDVNGPSKWYFDNGVYHRVFDDGRTASISIGDIPNPNELFEARKMLYPESKWELVKPQPATYELWAHRQGVE